MNADGIIGQTGELLGHNLFAYCKNNVVNLEDSSGFRPMYAGEETDAMREASFAAMATATKISSSHVGGNSGYPLKSDAISSALTGALPSAIDSGTACYLATMRSMNKVYKISQQALPEGGVSPEMTSFSKTKPLLGAAKGFYKYLGGTATLAAFGYCVWDDLHHSHSAGRILIDAGGTAGGILIGLALAPLELPALAAVGISAGVGFGIGMGTSYIKRRAYGN